MFEVYRWTKATLRKPRCLSAGSYSLYLQLKPTIWAQGYPRKYTNCTTPFEEGHFPAPLRHAEKQQLYWNWEKLSLQSSSLQPPKLNVDDLARGAPRRVTQCLWIGHTTFPLRGGHSSTGLSPPQRNLRRQFLGVRWCYDVQLGRYWETKDARKRIKLALTIYTVISCKVFLSDFERRSNVNHEQLEWSLHVFSLRANVISFLCAKYFWLRWLKRLCLARKV